MSLLRWEEMMQSKCKGKIDWKIFQAINLVLIKICCILSFSKYCLAVYLIDLKPRPDIQNWRFLSKHSILSLTTLSPTLALSLFLAIALSLSHPLSSTVWAQCTRLKEKKKNKAAQTTADSSCLPKKLSLQLPKLLPLLKIWAKRERGEMN